MENMELIDRYAHYLRTGKRVSQNSIMLYLGDIRQYMTFLTNHKKTDVCSAATNMVMDYIAYLEENGKATATVKRSLSSLKSFYKFLVDEREIEDSPAKDVTVSEAAIGRTEVLTVSEVELLLNQPRCTDEKGWRDRAMLELLYATGICASELLALDVSHVNLSAGIIRCVGKKQARIIPIYPGALHVLEKYLKRSRPRLVSNEKETALFVNRDGTRMSRQGFWKLLRSYQRAANIRKDVTPQILRRSFAVHLLENGADLQVLQQLMGHEDIASTRRYLDLIKGKTETVYLQTHPLAKRRDSLELQENVPQLRMG